MKTEEYICIIAEVFDGYTETVFNGETVFVKHFSLIDQRYLEGFQTKHFERAVRKGLPTEEESLEFLRENDLWTDADESSIKVKRDELSNLRITKNQLPLASQRDSLQERIDELSSEIVKMEVKRKDLLGITAEHYAENRSNEEFLRRFIYTDEGLTSLLFTQEAFDELETRQLIQVQQLRIDINERLDDDVIQRAILKPFFALYMSMCEDALSFYGKPAVELSIPQLKLLAYGRMFQNIFSYTENIPDNIREDPKKLISFSEAQRNKGGKDLIRDDADGSMVFGATKEDMKEIAGAEGTVKLGDVLKEKGGKLNMEDMMKLSGHE